MNRYFKITATKQQLQSIGIDYEITGIIGKLLNIFPTGYLQLRVEHKLASRMFVNNFDIPLDFLEEQVIIPKSLTAENGAKSLLIGEFFEKLEYYDTGEDEYYTTKVPVSWSTIKDIYDKIVEHYVQK